MVIRLLYVTATASGSNLNVGIYNNSSSPTMTKVKATASGGGDNYGIYNYYSSPTMANVTANASGGIFKNYGLLNYYSSPTMTNVTATASGGTSGNYGVYNYNNSRVTMRSCNMKGTTAGNYNFGYCLSRIIRSSIIGGIDGDGGFICINSDNGADKLLDSSCAVIP